MDKGGVYTLLSKLSLPGDLPNLNDEELKSLSDEIRNRLLEVVSETGGHLASNLGVVELTLAMYCVWDPFQTKIVWDVGHQTYVHKILTGRNNDLMSLRKYGGISGFPKREECLADCFNTGHSSTSISAALGILRAQKIKNEKGKVIAVIGDGALTGGMAFEALNDAAREFGDLIIILNDNGMSISRNVGGMARYLGKIRTGKQYIKIKKKFKNFLLKIPFVGAKLVRIIQKFKLSLKLLIIPGEIFEELGLNYIGPVDGHNIKATVQALKKADYMDGPILVHVVTKKGHGFEPAEKNPDMYHGVSPFDITSGEIRKCTDLSFSKSFSRHLCELADKDPNIVAVTAAMQNGTGLKDFVKDHDDRFFDVGIAEQHAITMAAGMASSGIKPFVAMYSTFLQRAYDQLLHDAALQSLPVIVAVDRAGISGADGETHQGIYDLAYLNHIPNTTVAAPCCVEEQKQLMDIAAMHTSGPFIIRYPAYDNYIHDREYILKNPCVVGKGLIMNSEEDDYDISVIAIGKMVNSAMNVADKLRNQNYRTCVFNARFLSPLDIEGIEKAVRKSKCYMTLEDGVKTGGFGSSVVCAMIEKGIYRRTNIVGLPDEPIPHGSIEDLFKKYGLDDESLLQRSLSLIHGEEVHGQT